MVKAHFFSLIELVVVMAIILLVAGLAVGRLGVLPTFATMEKTVRGMERLFARGAYMAALQGRQIEIDYLPSDRVFAISDGDSKWHLLPDNRQYLNQSDRSLELADVFSITFDRAESGDTPVVFLCHPDGTYSGPRMELTLAGETVKLRFSPLTGNLIRETVEAR